MQATHADTLKRAVRETYGRIASGTASGCGCGTDTSCCGTAATAPPSSLALGYDETDLAEVPPGADLGLGCGNPQAIASLQAGERVLDLGSGAGFDAFLAARQVGPTGRVIGVDMTPEMVAKAQRNARTIDAANVEFRLGEIERLPVADESVDVIMSNCVINLSPDKRAVFREAYRVLAPGGRLAISDIVAVATMPAALRNDLAAYTGCVAGAALVPEIEAMLAAEGFSDIRVEVKGELRDVVDGWTPDRTAGDYVASALIQAVKTPACCDSTLLDRCCQPAEKPECCGTTAAPASACGCQTSDAAGR